jgi:Tfp pilus assembly major pilin PilA
MLMSLGSRAGRKRLGDAVLDGDFASEAYVDAAFQSTVATIPNYIWNGMFQVWQRGTSFTSFASRLGVADGWTFARSGLVAGATVSQQAGSNQPYCIRVQRDSGNTATNTMNLVFNLTREQSLQLAGKTIVYGCRARAGANFSAASGNMFCGLRYTTHTSQQAVTAAAGSYTTGDASLDTITAPLTTSWQDFTDTASVPSNCTQLLMRVQFVPVGTAGAADYFEIEEIYLFVASVKPVVRPLPFHDVFRWAQSQFWKSYNYDIAPGASSTPGNLYQVARGTEATGAINWDIRLPTAMISTPTVTVYSTTGASGKIRDETGAADINGAAADVGTQGFVVQNTAATTSGRFYSCQVTAESAL